MPSAELYHLNAFAADLLAGRRAYSAGPAD